MQMLQALLARVHRSPAPNAARLDDGMDYIQIHHPEIAGKYAHLFDAADGTILPQDKADAAALGKVLDHLPDFRKMMEELAIAEGHPAPSAPPRYGKKILGPKRLARNTGANFVMFRPSIGNQNATCPKDRVGDSRTVWT